MGWVNPRSDVFRGPLAPLRSVVQSLQDWLDTPRVVSGVGPTSSVPSGSAVVLRFASTVEAVGARVAANLASLVFESPGVWEVSGCVELDPTAIGSVTLWANLTAPSGAVSTVELGANVLRVGTWNTRVSFSVPVQVGMAGSSLTGPVVQHDTGVNVNCHLVSFLVKRVA